MREEVRILTLDKYEFGLLINALNEFRNKLIRENQDTEFVDEVLLKTIEAPCKKKVLTKCLRIDERY